MFLGLVALMGGLAGCEDRITEEEIPVDSGKLVTVPLTFDFAPETEGYEIASGSPRARLGLASGSPRARLGLASGSPRARLGLALKAVIPPSARACAPKCHPVM